MLLCFTTSLLYPEWTFVLLINRRMLKAFLFIVPWGLTPCTLRSQPHFSSSPLLHALVTAYATLAAEIAYTNAASLVPVKRCKKVILIQCGAAGYRGYGHLLILMTVPCVTTLPKTGMESSVEQFHRRLRNWYWHSSMASWAPRRTASITSTLRLQICTCLWMRPRSFSQVSSSEMLPTDDSLARYLSEKEAEMSQASSENQTDNKYVQNRDGTDQVLGFSIRMILAKKMVERRSPLLTGVKKN